MYPRRRQKLTRRKQTPALLSHRAAANLPIPAAIESLVNVQLFAGPINLTHLASACGIQRRIRNHSQNLTILMRVRIHLRMSIVRSEYSSICLRPYQVHWILSSSITHATANRPRCQVHRQNTFQKLPGQSLIIRLAKTRCMDHHNPSRR